MGSGLAEPATTAAPAGRRPEGIERLVAWVALLAAVALAVVATYGERAPALASSLAAAPGAAAPGARLGAPAPDFAVPATTGGVLGLAEFRGRPVVLNFWATWCPPCRTEMPEFERFQREQGARVVVLGIDMQEDPAVVGAFLRQYGISYRIGLDGDGRVSTLYAVTGLPTTVFVDSAGVVRDRVVGPLTYDGLVQRARRLQ